MSAPKPTPTLSVIIITLNEAHAISLCLASVAWADEVIVLDAGSTDETVALCRDWGAKVSVNTDWQGFGIQKNRALALATGDWVLSLDADEVVSPSLQTDIQMAVQQSQNHSYAMPRHSNFCGQRIRYCGWQSDVVTRLFKRGYGRFSDDRVHEALQLDHPTIRFSSPLLHDSYISLEEALDKLNHYSSAGAKMALAQGKTSSLGRAILRGLWAFLRTYVLRLGFLDGRKGFVLAVLSAEHAYYKALKIAFESHQAT